MIPVAEARERVLSALTPLPMEQVSVVDGFGRVLGESLRSRRTQPPEPVSAMDGYAVRADDIVAVPARLRVVGYAPAGAAYGGTLKSGEAVRIFTGAPVPEGADTIVIQEDTSAENGIVVVNEGAKRGTYVRPAGLDFREGDVLLNGGTLLGARQVGLAAAMNVPWLMVYRRPRVAILATGDEIVMPGDPIGANQIVSSNAISLAAFVRAMGGDPILLGIAPDERNSLARMLDGIKGADMLVTTGGASVGDHDLVQKVLGERGMQIDFWQIAMRPGKPLMFGQIEGVPVLGLPGNPVSSLVCAMIFLRPALARLQGRSADEDNPVPMKLGQALAANDKREDYLRAQIRRNDAGEPCVFPFSRQDSSMLAILSSADALVVRAPFAQEAAAGQYVDTLPIPVGIYRV